jgi:hypothetical protein
MIHITSAIQSDCLYLKILLHLRTVIIQYRQFISTSCVMNNQITHIILKSVLQMKSAVFVTNQKQATISGYHAVVKQLLYHLKRELYMDGFRPN